MTAVPDAFRFTCGCCGKTVSGVPDLAYAAPLYYDQLPEAERAGRATLDTDLCVIDGEHFFIRVVCPVPIKGTEETFMWGVWTTLSEANFQRYRATFEDPDQSKLGGMFGWLSNRIPHYPDTLGLQTTVWPQDDRQRPHLRVNDVHAEHPLYREQRDGMDLARLAEIYAKEICESSRGYP